MRKVYLIVREDGTRELEISDKVYLSKRFAEKVCNDWNEVNLLRGIWSVRELEVDNFSTAEEE